MLQVIFHSALTLCMMAVLFRWAAPWLEVDVYRGYFRWLPGTIDPAINALRRALPPMGAIDLTPMVAIGILWILRVVLSGS